MLFEPPGFTSSSSSLHPIRFGFDLIDPGLVSPSSRLYPSLLNPARVGLAGLRRDGVGLSSRLYPGLLNPGRLSDLPTALLPVGFVIVAAVSLRDAPSKVGFLPLLLGAGFGADKLSGPHCGLLGGPPNCCLPQVAKPSGGRRLSRRDESRQGSGGGGDDYADIGHWVSGRPCLTLIIAYTQTRFRNPRDLSSPG